MQCKLYFVFVRGGARTYNYTEFRVLAVTCQLLCEYTVCIRNHQMKRDFFFHFQNEKKERLVCVCVCIAISDWNLIGDKIVRASRCEVRRQSPLLLSASTVVRVFLC